MVHLRTAGAAVALVGALAGGVAAASPASAVTANIQTTDSVNVRPGPGVSSGNPLAVMPAGTSPTFNCWAQGQNIGGVDVWFNVTYNGVTGYYSSFYDNSHYAHDADITAKYGIAQCGSGPVVTAAQQSAVNWARSYADGAGTPPAGALVFYAARNGDRTFSHVTLSVGGGNTVSTSDAVDGAKIHYETISQHRYANYLGWWLPAS